MLFLFMIFGGWVLPAAIAAVCLWWLRMDLFPTMAIYAGMQTTVTVWALCSIATF